MDFSIGIFSFRLLLLKCAITNSTCMVGTKGLDDVPGSFQQKKDLKRIPEFAG
jgi:hypothetical protein